jgi:hypothetical protein
VAGRDGIPLDGYRRHKVEQAAPRRRALEWRRPRRDDGGRGLRQPCPGSITTSKACSSVPGPGRSNAIGAALSLDAGDHSSTMAQ